MRMRMRNDRVLRDQQLQVLQGLLLLRMTLGSRQATPRVQTIDCLSIYRHRGPKNHATSARRVPAVTG